MSDLAAAIGDPYLALLIGLLAGLSVTGITVALFWIAARRRRAALRRQAEGIIANAEREAEQIFKAGRIDLQEERLETKAAFDRESWETKQELGALEQQLARTETEVGQQLAVSERRAADLAERDAKLAAHESRMQSLEEEGAALMARQRARLEELSGMTSKEAKGALLEQLEAEAKAECAQRLRSLEEDMQEQARKKAEHIITTAIERCAVDVVTESTVSVVPLPNEEMKGRIIGREGRNIHALEHVTGIDIIVDDTPEAVILSGFDPVRREMARMTLERLIADGRIHPARIEEVHAKVQEEMDAIIQDGGEQAAVELGFHDVHPEIIRLLGRLKFRTSYGQNVLAHSKEVAYICGMMAAEYGLDERLARRCGLMHDLGKAITHESAGPHAATGGEVARRYGELPEVINAIESHHDDVEKTTLYSVLAQVGDAISAARPGARREMLETYVKRLAELEQIALAMPGVERAYAVRAGRELRVIIEADKVTDAQMWQLSRDIARAVEQTLEYPGRIRVTCIRESRAVEYAS